MKWGRGFFRLWAVLAVCWVVIAAYILSHELVAMIHPSLSVEDLVKLHQEPNSVEALEIRKDMEAQQRIADWPERIKAIGWILLPPPILLTLVYVIGLVMAWIARGFRSSAAPEG